MNELETSIMKKCVVNDIETRNGVFIRELLLSIKFLGEIKDGKEVYLFKVNLGLNWKKIIFNERHVQSWIQRGRILDYILEMI